MPRLCLAVTLMALSPLAAAPAEVVDVSTRTQLFIDDYLIADSAGLIRTLHQPQRRPEALLRPQMPWEYDALLLQGVVFFDDADQLYRMYYSSLDVIQGDAYDETQDVLLATSKDGLTWERPRLGLVEFEGSKDNNIIYWMMRGQRPPDRQWWGYQTVVKDPHDADPARRYKFLGWGGKPGGPFGVELMFSPDGLHFTECEKHPIIVSGDAGSQTVGWVDSLGCYVMFVRGNDNEGRRIVCRTTSQDFVNWEPAGVVLQMRPDDQPGLQFYQMPVALHEGAYYGMLWVLRTGVEGHPIETELVFSRDGINWTRVGNGATFLPVGPKGSYEETMVFPAAPLWVGDEIRIYYGATNLPHDLAMANVAKNITGGIGLATLRRDRWVSMHAGETEGTLTTKPFVVEGDRLIVNANAQGGSLSVAVLDADGNPIRGFDRYATRALRGDDLRHEFRWSGGGIGALKGQQVRLRFTLRNAQLYAFLVQ